MCKRWLKKKGGERKPLRGRWHDDSYWQMLAHIFVEIAGPRAGSTGEAGPGESLWSSCKALGLLP